MNQSEYKTYLTFLFAMKISGNIIFFSIVISYVVLDVHFFWARKIKFIYYSQQFNHGKMCRFFIFIFLQWIDGFYSFIKTNPFPLVWIFVLINKLIIYWKPFFQLYIFFYIVNMTCKLIKYFTKPISKEYFLFCDFFPMNTLFWFERECEIMTYSNPQFNIL